MTQSQHPDKAQDLASHCASLRAFVLAAANPSSYHDFEQQLPARLLAAGRAAVAEFLDARGTGDLGESLTLPTGEVVRRLGQARDRPFTCLFGAFVLTRFCYGSREGQKVDIAPLDLPEGKFSYLLQDLNNLFAAEQPFARAAEALERLPGLPILVRTADAEGLVMRPEPGAAAPGQAHKRGPKAGRKKEAILGCVPSARPLVRAARDVVDSLFRQARQEGPAGPPRPRLGHKRVITLLNEYHDGEGRGHDGMAEAFAWIDQQLRSATPAATR